MSAQSKISQIANANTHEKVSRRQFALKALTSFSVGTFGVILTQFNSTFLLVMGIMVVFYSLVTALENIFYLVTGQEVGNKIVEIVRHFMGSKWFLRPVYGLLSFVFMVVILENILSHGPYEELLFSLVFTVVCIDAAIAGQRLFSGPLCTWIKGWNKKF